MIALGARIPMHFTIGEGVDMKKDPVKSVMEAAMPRHTAGTLMRRYSMLEILQALEAEPDMPYALYADAAQKAHATATENPDYAWVLPYLREETEKYRVMPITTPTFKAYANFDRIGERHLFDTQMYELRTRLNTLALAVLLDIEGAKAPYEDILYAFLHLPTWSLSAHLLDHSTEDYWDYPTEPFDETGRVRGTGRTRKQSQDLCSTSAAFMLCEMAQLLEGKVEPCLLRWSRQEAYGRIIGNFMSCSPYLYFESLPTNWSGVCMSSIGAAAIYLITEPRTLAPILLRVLEGLRVHETGYSDDGMCPEGFGYWQYGFEYYLMFAELLKRRTGGRMDILGENEKMRRVAGFGTNCCFGHTLKLPFGDANCHGILDEAVRRYVGCMGVPVPPQGDTKASFLAAWEHCPLQLRHLLWTEKPADVALAYPRSATYPQSQCYMGCYRAQEDPVCLLVKGGNNGESHNHNDVGTFVISRGDNMIASDPGGGDYCREYFREQRYTFFAARSMGHNFPIVDGTEQTASDTCAARSFDVRHEGDRDTISIDLTGVLAVDALAEQHRLLSGDLKTGRITVEDIFELTRPTEIRDRIVTLFEPEPIGYGVIRIGGAQGMTLRFDEDALIPAVEKVMHHLHDQDHVFTLDLIPRTQHNGTVCIRMVWDIE